MISSKDKIVESSEIDYEILRSYASDFKLPKIMDKFRSIFHPVRFSMMLILDATTKIERGELLNELNINSGTLERHLNTLKDNNLVHVTKEFIGEKITTLISASGEGLTLFKEFKETMQILI